MNREEENKIKKPEIIESKEQTLEKRESFEDLVRALEVEIEECSDDFKKEDSKKESIQMSVGLNKKETEEVLEELKIDENLNILNKEVDKLKRNIFEKIEVKTILSRIRDSSKTYKVIKAVLLLELISSGFLVGKFIGDKKKEKTEDMNMAKKYLVKNDIKNIDASRFFNDNFVSEVALTMKGGDKEDLIEKKEVLLATFKSSSQSKITLDKTDSLIFKKMLTKYEEDINNEKEKLSKEDKEGAKEKIVELIALVEQAKLELIDHIQSDEYQKKLMEEMGISKKVAEEHQKTRISNVENINYEFKTSWGIDADTDGRGYAYFDQVANKIVMPFNINLVDEDEREYFTISLLHEMLHQSTRAGMGISREAWDSLTNSFKQIDSTESNIWIDYFSNPVELIVRKQILDLKMEKLGIKKYGEEFTGEHYEELLKLMESGELSQNELEFINHIKPEKFVQIMNELASVDDSGKKYFHPGWDYNGGEEDNKA